VEIKRPTFDLWTCISCGQCVEDCKFGALTLTHDFELAVFKKESLEMKKALVIGK
jgi:formate hydrogenlyase subunit 6/NADH:ubiquinone oxidoreductase subunit I